MGIQETIKNYFDYINKEEFDRFFNLFTEDAVVSCPVDLELKGLEEIKSFYLKVPENYPEHEDKPLDVLIDGNRAAVLIQFEGKTASGKVVGFRAADWFTFEKDKIKTVTVFYDSIALSRKVKGR